MQLIKICSKGETYKKLCIVAIKLVLPRALKTILVAGSRLY